ncbi:MAG: RrF2 family transcriptional regulator [Parvularculaceae bacterium]
MRLTLYTDYTLRILLYLAVKRGELATIQEIAERYAISKNHLMKIVHNLGKDGYIETVRGRGGGIRLAVAPVAVNIGEVVRRYEDDMRIIECFDEISNTCPIAGVCALTDYFGDALEAFLKTLDCKTLADVLKASPKISKRLGV